ncbi:FxsA family protein [Kiloniella antarctica]|uniref:FxsA family protein n=1 Tax=Kiloniella antarctica TaxID=1550907 RepID=A0ABW5BGQ7_9PROT
MGIIFLFLFIGIPLLEIIVLIEVGDQIGLWSTIGLIILTAIIGTWMLRLQGLATLANAQKQLNQGAVPAQEIFDGICLLAAGALLLTPGFVTDSIGFSLLLPPVREILRNTVGKKISTRMQNAQARQQSPGQSSPQPPFTRPNTWKNDNNIIDGDFQDVTKNDHDRLK